ncbi:MAG TPA: tryptophan halogenase family protein [Croceibacterium sp.]
MRIIIVGGGTAGWITAGYLARAFNAVERSAEITLIESPDAGRIGVGEATFPTLRRTLSHLQIDEREFLRRTGATFKHGVRFENWARTRHSYYHTFEALLGQTGGETGDAWLARRSANEARPFAYEYGVQAFAADAGRAPKLLSDPEYMGQLNYAYHVDADLLGDLLCEKMVAAGVQHLRDDVVDVVRAGDTGLLEAVIGRREGRLDADFFVDCTGFAAVLLGKALDVPFVPYGQYLLCDRAVALRLPYASDHEAVDPFTTARALDYGWMWKVGLQSRSGQGHVYCSAMLSDDDAEQQLRQVTGAGSELPARRLKFRTGRSARSWEANCVAIGLAGGFIEPLESTGIYLIEEGARLLARLMPLDGGGFARSAEAYNRHMASLYEEIRDFIVLHYCVTRRDDTPFWQAVQRPEHIPDRVRELMQLWKGRSPAPEDLATSHAFPALSYQYVLYGMDWITDEAARRARLKGAALPPPELEGRRAELLRLLPRHGEYLQTLSSPS